MRNHAWMWILWPSFLVAGAASATVFALVDPLDIAFFGHVTAGRQLVYAGGFFFFWLMAALSSALTLHMAPRARIRDELSGQEED